MENFYEQNEVFFRWVATNMNDGKVKISHKILEKRIKMYEPFYVSSDDIPPYDERFLGYGFTRNSQVYSHDISIVACIYNFAFLKYYQVINFFCSLQLHMRLVGRFSFCHLYFQYTGVSKQIRHFCIQKRTELVGMSG